MSKSMNSPTARLLRSSRLFSLPPPLPPSPGASQNVRGAQRGSNTATEPYPTHQAISTPRSSRHRGDWGLKRPLPDRSIPKTTAHLRINAIDNLNHITDFASAANHTQTVEKWQELNMPLTMRGERKSFANSRLPPPVSVFEEDVDNTALNSSDPSGKAVDLTATISAERAILMHALLPQQRGKRWKTEGPWVNSLSEQEFQQYLASVVRKHKPGFLEYLAHIKRDHKKKKIMQNRRDEGLLPETDADQAAAEFGLEQASTLADGELSDFIKELRDNHEEEALSSDLSAYVRQYFDLPAFAISGVNNFERSLGKFGVAPEKVPNPPSTHPSAGLGYLRSRAFMENHPTYGPQLHHAPIESRVLRTRALFNDGRATLGIAGFVTDEGTSHGGTNVRPPESGSSKAISYSRRQDLARQFLDLETPGGNKIWLDPTSATIDEKGLVKISVTTADEHAVGVKTGKPIEAPKSVSTHSMSQLDLKLPNARRRLAPTDAAGGAAATTRAQPFANVRPTGDARADMGMIDQLYKTSGSRDY